MDLEYKSYAIEAKAVDDTGTFTGLASPYNNIDDGGDRVLPSVGKMNNSKNVVMLWQHDTKSVIGNLILTDTPQGIQCKGSFVLDKDDTGNYLVPKAAEAYALAKKGLLKLSIGYQTLDYAYAKVNGLTVRDLKSINIMEVSLVTFPMNPQATISDVKQEGGNKNMDGDKEEKALSFADVLKVQQANDMRWKLQDALNCAFGQLMEDDTMDINTKLAQLEQNVDDFAAAYKENMALLLQASASAKANKTAQKQISDILEKKSNNSLGDLTYNLKINTDGTIDLLKKELGEQLETKAGKKISKANMDKIKAAWDSLSSLLAGMMGDSPDDEGEPDDDKGCGKKPGTKSKEGKLETKNEDLEALQLLYKNIKNEGVGEK